MNNKRIHKITHRH